MAKSVMSLTSYTIFLDRFDVMLMHQLLNPDRFTRLAMWSSIQWLSHHSFGAIWLALAVQIERHCSAEETLQRRLIDLVAFVDVDGAPDIAFEAGVE
jgi:hypothetical protein